MKVVQSDVFFRTVKKLQKKEKTAIDRAIERVIANTSIGDMKKGALIGVRVYKSKQTINNIYWLTGMRRNQPVWRCWSWVYTKIFIVT